MIKNYSNISNHTYQKLGEKIQEIIELNEKESYQDEKESKTIQLILVIFFFSLVFCIFFNNYEKAVQSLEEDKEELRRDRIIKMHNLT